MSESKLTKLKERKEFFTTDDISGEVEYKGEIVVIGQKQLEDFKEEYQTPQNQLFIAQGGFGCHSYTSGSAVVGKFLLDGEKTRMERYEFIGVLKKSVANEMGLCPCGTELHEELVMNALSREDNETYICKDCEGKELQKELDKLNL